MITLYKSPTLGREGHTKVVYKQCIACSEKGLLFHRIFFYKSLAQFLKLYFLYLYCKFKEKFKKKTFYFEG
jgi:hypothetical protein